MEFRRRAVEYARFGDLARLRAPSFVKPADALDKSFDAGIYANARDIRTPKGVDAQNPVLLAEPVEWSTEYRCFIKEGEVAAWSPYISFARPVWKPLSARNTAGPDTGKPFVVLQTTLLSIGGLISAGVRDGYWADR
jgi:hypothetical protein